MNYTKAYGIALFTIVFVTMSVSAVHAQDEFTGTIQNYDGPAASVMTGMMVLIDIGTVDDNGNFSIPLDNNFINELNESVEQENESSDEWTTSLITTGRMFSCSNGEIEVTNTELPVVKLSSFGSYMIGNSDEQVEIGYFMATSSSEFADAFNSFGQMNAVEGYYLDWFYFEEPFSITGSCDVETYAKNQEDIYTQTTTYDLDFKEGWSLVKYMIDDIYEDPDGTNTPLSISYSTLESIPENVQYFFFE